MHKHAGFAAAHGIGHFAARGGGRKRHHAAGERFADAHDVGRDAGMFAGKKFAGAAKAGGDFIKNQQHAVFIAQSAHAAQIFGVIHTHAARALHNRLQNHGGDLAVVLPQGRVNRLDIACRPFAVEAALRRGHENMLGQKAAVEAVHRVYRVAHAHRAEGVAVIAVCNGEEFAARRAFAVPILQRHFQGHFHRHRAGIGQKNAFEIGRQHGAQRFAQTNSRLVGEAAEHHMRHGIELRFGRGG